MVLALMCAGLACRGTGTRPSDFSPLRNPDPLLRQGTTEELMGLLERRAPPHRTLQAQGRVSVEDQVENRRRWFDVNLLYREPDNVRLRGSRVGPGTLFEVLATNEESWFYNNRNRELFVGTVDDLRDHLGLLGSFDLSELMGSLMIAQEARKVIESGTMTDWRVRRNEVEFQETRGGLTRHWTVDRHSGLVRRVELREGPTVVATVEYDRYELIEGPEILPTQLHVTMPREGIRTRLRVSSYNLDPELREDIIFESRPRGARTIQPLWQLHWDGPEDAPEPQP